MSQQHQQSETVGNGIIFKGFLESKATSGEKLVFKKNKIIGFYQLGW